MRLLLGKNVVSLPVSISLSPYQLLGPVQQLLILIRMEKIMVTLDTEEE